MKHLRPLLMLAVILAACFASMKLSEHHEGTNENALLFLYQHVVPAPLVKHAAAATSHAVEGATTDHAVEYLVALPLPGFLSMFDGDAGHDGAQLVLTNLQIFQLVAVLLILIGFSGIPSYLRTGQGDIVTRTMTGFTMWVRDEMVVPIMGKESGHRFLPYFLSIFFFIFFCNLLGLVPGAATATASIYVTAAMALTTLVAMLGCGMVVQGPIAFWKNLVPEVPLVLWPLLFVVELVGLMVKPFALMIRLFANMTGGHLVVLSFMGLIFFFAGVEHSALGWAVSPFAVGMSVFVMIIEAFVAMLQAYIFAQLSILFVHASVHPDH